MRMSKRDWLGFASPAATGALAFGVGAGALFCNTMAVAQELEEVVVTAQRVESTAQETPIAIDVLSADDIQDRGIASVQDLALISPSVNVAGEGGGIVLTVRGVSSRDTTEIGDPAVVLSVDGFYQDQGQGFGLTQYDLERIEVLRGPQGTLYGRNATGGAVNIYTRRPQPDYEGYGLVELGGYGTVLPDTGLVGPRVAGSSCPIATAAILADSTICMRALDVFNSDSIPRIPSISASPLS